MNQTISIVTPVLNDPRVGRALDSVIGQSNRTQIQIIVIDGGSNEPTIREITERRDQIDVLISEPDAGIYDAMNKGIALATGDVVGILNADDRYENSDVLRRILN